MDSHTRLSDEFHDAIVQDTYIFPPLLPEPSLSQIMTTKAAILCLPRISCPGEERLVPLPTPAITSRYRVGRNVMQENSQLLRSTRLEQTEFAQHFSLGVNQARLLHSLRMMPRLQYIAIETAPFWPTALHQEFHFWADEQLRTDTLRVIRQFIQLIPLLLDTTPELQLRLLCTDPRLFDMPRDCLSFSKLQHLQHLHLDFTLNDDSLGLSEAEYMRSLADAHTFIQRCTGLRTFKLTMCNGCLWSSGGAQASGAYLNTLIAGVRLPLLEELTVVGFDVPDGELRTLLSNHEATLREVHLYSIRVDCTDDRLHLLDQNWACGQQHSSREELENGRRTCGDVVRMFHSSCPRIRFHIDQACEDLDWIHGRVGAFDSTDDSESS